ncbi:hypothetical protein, partial [Variovorax sp. GrIS 2.14]|uniref:hypothetical protein n=1 Tax=Variovorax sp. GrIS 2.14 TaxID=3071709 RepID=UPI0038F6F385
IAGGASPTPAKRLNAHAKLRAFERRTTPDSMRRGPGARLVKDIMARTNQRKVFESALVRRDG